MAKGGASRAWARLKYSTTVVRPGINPDYDTKEFVVYWAKWVTEEEVPKRDEEGVVVTDESNNIVYEMTQLDRPTYREDRLSGFPTLSEAYRHAAIVREMRYA